MLPFGVTIPAAVLLRSDILEGLMNYPVYFGERFTLQNVETGCKTQICAFDTFLC
jgi:hypothetical protein